MIPVPLITFIPTQEDGGEPPEQNHFLLEDGDQLLLEDGDNLLLQA